MLDHGFVRVIDYMGDDAAIVQAARVSYGRGTRKVSEDAGLIRYLMRHEWAETAEDVLWRRSKLGLVLIREQREAVGRFMTDAVGPKGKSSTAPLSARQARCAASRFTIEQSTLRNR